MNVDIFKKVIGKHWKYVTDGEHVIPGTVVSLMIDYEIDVNLLHGALYSINSFDFYLFAATNDKVWKDDGQTTAINIIVYDTLKKQACIYNNLTSFTNKELKRHIRIIKNNILSIENEEIIKSRIKSIIETNPQYAVYTDDEDYIYSFNEQEDGKH